MMSSENRRKETILSHGGVTQDCRLVLANDDNVDVDDDGQRKSSQTA